MNEKSVKLPVNSGFAWGWFSVLACILLSSPVNTWAQASASIVGNVADSSGAVIKNAKITVKSLDTGATREAATDDAGNFQFLALPLGPQEVRAEKQGFKPLVRSGMNLVVGQEAVINLRLDVGDFVQQISVVEEVPIVNTTTASVAGMVGERQIKELPLNGRSFDNLIALNPSTINYSAMKRFFC